MLPIRIVSTVEIDSLSLPNACILFVPAQVGGCAATTFAIKIDFCWLEDEMIIIDIDAENTVASMTRLLYFFFIVERRWSAFFEHENNLCDGQSLNTRCTTIIV
jgi:hypothetical protein